MACGAGARGGRAGLPLDLLTTIGERCGSFNSFSPRTLGHCCCSVARISVVWFRSPRRLASICFIDGWAAGVAESDEIISSASRWKVVHGTIWPGSTFRPFIIWQLFTIFALIVEC